ncbi:hypothetical protein D3C72_1532810 [compost metagenome]
MFAVEFAQFLAVGNDGAHARLGEEGGNAGAAGAQFFGQGALRREFQFQFAGQVLAREFLVFTHVGGNHFLDLARGQELAQAEAVHARVIRNGRQARHAGIAQGSDQGFGNAAQAEAADGDGLAILDDTGQRRGGVRINFIHGCPSIFC